MSSKKGNGRALLVFASCPPSPKEETYPECDPPGPVNTRVLKHSFIRSQYSVFAFDLIIVCLALYTERSVPHWCTSLSMRLSSPDWKSPSLTTEPGAMCSSSCGELWPYSSPLPETDSSGPCSCRTCAMYLC